MQTRSITAKKKRLSLCKENEELIATVDRITDLPDAVLHHILSLLPINTVAQTSTLSKRWRLLWSSFPDLDFTTLQDHNYSKTHSLMNSNKESDFITRVLNNRDKLSDLRTLRFHARLSFSRLNGLIRLAIRHKVQILDVEVLTEDYFNFPRCVIYSETLRVLKLKSKWPGFRLPPSSVMTSGFRNLQSLSLLRVSLCNQPCLSDMFSESAFVVLKRLSLDTCFGLKQLRVGCRALQDLTLESCFELRELSVIGLKLERLRIVKCFDGYVEKSWVKIDAPRLGVILWENNGISDNVWIEDLSYLRKASIGLLHEDISVAKLQSVSNLFSAMSLAHCLTLESNCIEILSNNNYFAVYFHQFSNLKSLELHTRFKKNNVPGLASIFKSCPMLHTLILNIINNFKTERRQWNPDLWEMYNSEEEKYWESEAQNLKSFLQHLKIVKIFGFLECENEVSLAKFLLKHGKALEEMILSNGQCKTRYPLQRQKTRSQMMRFSWASSNAIITFN